MPSLTQWIHIASIVLSFTAGAALYLGQATIAGVLVLFAIPCVNAVGAYLNGGASAPAPVPNP